MRSRLAAHVRTNVVGYIALFIALGGVAYALEANSVRSKHIKDGQVRTADVADDTGPNALTGTDIATDSLENVDINESTLFNNDTLDSADINESTLYNDDSLDTSDIDEFSLGGFNPNSVGPRAYARVETTGDVTEADTKGLADANVTEVASGTITCFDTGFDVHTISGTVESAGPLDRFVLAYNQGGPPCGVGDDAMAMVWDVSALALDGATPYYIEMN